MADSSTNTRRVALVANASFYMGPPLARLLAQRGHDLIVGDPGDGIVEELESYGAAVEVVTGVGDLGNPEASAKLVKAALDRFGRIDAATSFSGAIVIGPFLESSVDDFQIAINGCLEAPYHFLKAVAPVMVEQGGGQILVITSASAARATPGAPLYSSARAGANHLVRNVAAEVARHGVQVNALGTNFLDFPEFLKATGADDPEVRKIVEGMVPMGRLGTLEESAALCMGFLDGTCEFVTGQFIAQDGGWS